MCPFGTGPHTAHSLAGGLLLGAYWGLTGSPYGFGLWGRTHWLAYCQNIHFGMLRSRAAFVFVAPATIITSKHHLRNSKQFSPPPCRFQPVQNLRNLRKEVRLRKISKKLDQKAKETREERPNDGAGEAEGGGGAPSLRRLLLHVFQT